jgi:hypothetical protein
MKTTVNPNIITSDDQETASLIVAGNIVELGSWNLSNGFTLKRDTSSNIWRGTIRLSQGIPIEFNYYFNNQPLSTFLQREISNREIRITEGIEIHIEENFDKIGDMRIFKNVGYLQTNYELRVWFDDKQIKFYKPLVDDTITYKIKPLTFKENKIKLSDPDNHSHEIRWEVPTLEDMGILILFKSENSKKILGRAVVLASEFSPLIGTLMRPILDASFSVIGNLSFQYLVVTPFHHEKNIFYDDVLGSNWGSSIDMIGHRGMGVNRTSYIRENTLLSFKTAHLQGIKYVEFDVHLTTDNVPVIYHDFFHFFEGCISFYR